MKRKPLLYFGGACVCALAALYVLRDSRADLIADALTHGNHEATPNPQWWPIAARCLGMDTIPHPSKTFVGGHLPTSWRKPWDRKPADGYTVEGDTALIWVARLTDSLWNHEHVHAVLGAGHPESIFGTKGTAPRCGLAPAYE